VGVEGLVLNFVESSLAGQIINGRTESGDGDTIRKLAGERAWSDRGFRALHLAADLGRSNVVRALLDSGAHKNARALVGSFEVLSLLLGEGADKNAVNRDGDTPLHRTMCGPPRCSWVDLRVMVTSRLQRYS
jgi:hypothetical protein